MSKSITGQHAQTDKTLQDIMHGPTYLRVQLLRSHGGSERKAYFFPAKERGELSFAVADTGMLAACFPTSDEGAEAREQYISPGIFFF